MRADMKKIALLCALDYEITGLTEKLEGSSKETVLGTTFTKGSYGDKKVCMATTGVGKTAAAGTAMQMIQYFDPDVIFNIGMAGSCNKSLPVGGVVVASVCGYHDFYLDNPQDFGVLTEFKPDEALVEKELDICETLNIKALAGKVATGDRFVDGSEIKEEIRRRTDCDCVDMESAAIAQIALKCGVAYGVVKILSDSADENASEDFAFSALEYSEAAGKIALEFIKRA